MKGEYYSNLDEKNISDNKAFLKNVKPVVSKKIKFNERITRVVWLKMMKSLNLKKELQKF